MPYSEDIIMRAMILDYLNCLETADYEKLMNLFSATQKQKVPPPIFITIG